MAKIRQLFHKKASYIFDGVINKPLVVTSFLNYICHFVYAEITQKNFFPKRQLYYCVLLLIIVDFFVIPVTSLLSKLTFPG